jgi:HEAT repeat protein
MSKQDIEANAAAIDALRNTPEEAPALVKKALADRNNYLVSRAARVAGELHLVEMAPLMLAAFDRFMKDPAKTDPQCWAKNEIAKALKDLGHNDADVYLRGSRHVQMEPVWGGQVDTAGKLRGSCLLALIDCRVDDVTLLNLLADALADPLKEVRVDAALALSHAGIPESCAVLRLKAKLGDPELEVTGQCLASLLALSPRDGVPFAAKFLDSEDDELTLEAASALAQCHDEAVLGVLKAFWKRKLAPEVRNGLRMILKASRYKDEFELDRD